MLALGRQVLASQPFSALIGAELSGFAPGSAELRAPITPQLLQQHGYVHGGALAYMADNVLTFAGGSALGTAVLTAEFKINYVRPAQGEALIARAAVVAGGGRQAVCRCEIYAVTGGEEVLCAVAQGTIVRIGGADPAPAE